MTNFSEALDALKKGKRISRTGWNGTGMFAVYSPGMSLLSAEKFFSVPLREYAESLELQAMSVRPSLMLKTAQNDVAYWVPSCSDLLAEDWLILD